MALNHGEDKVNAVSALASASERPVLCEPSECELDDNAMFSKVIAARHA